MGENILLGRGQRIVKYPRRKWEQDLAQAPERIAAGLDFMSKEHHRARNFVVRELPQIGKPLTPEFIAAELNLPLVRVNVILDDLEKNLTFLFRNEQGAVVWAYPVTVAETPHRVSFSSGEQVNAA